MRILDRLPTQSEIDHCLPLLAAYDQDLPKVSAAAAEREKRSMPGSRPGKSDITAPSHGRWWFPWRWFQPAAPR